MQVSRFIVGMVVLRLSVMWFGIPVANPQWWRTILLM